ncbi:hypothetical protein AB1Y20_015192 [Prymnesium parvum]|uniref:Protein regulator of cytokinesis 1 n=1 Tax=Prymnesium parvum TaxID=97485 RepID=A0AB34JZV6_PRYPA
MGCDGAAVDAQKLLDDVRSELSELWESAGVTQDDQAKASDEVIRKLVELLNGVVSEEKARHAHLKEQVPLLEEELSQLSNILVEEFQGGAVDPDALLIPRHNELSKRVERARNLVKERKAVRVERESQLRAVLAELALTEEERSEQSNLFVLEPTIDMAGGLSSPLLERTRQRLSDALAEKAARIDKAAFLAMGIDRLRLELGAVDANVDHSLSSVSSKVSSSALACKEAELAQLQTEAERRKQVLADCSEYIRELQLRLQLPAEECNNLPGPDQGLSPHVLEEYHRELERLEALKAKNLSRLLRNARERLKPLWNDLHFSEQQTRNFEAAWAPIIGEGETTSTEGDATEEALFAVEEEEHRLQVRLKECEKMLQLMSKREEILAQRAEMIAAAADPSRLTDRGKRDPGRLLREEKLRVKVEKDLPKMNKRLRELSAEWSAAHPDDQLTYDGRPICVILDEQEAEFIAEKDEERKRKEAEKMAKEEAKHAGKPQVTPRQSNSGPPHKKAVGATAGAAMSRRVATAPVSSRVETAGHKGESGKDQRHPPSLPSDVSPAPQTTVPSERVLRALDMSSNTALPTSPTKTATLSATSHAVPLD